MRIPPWWRRGVSPPANHRLPAVLRPVYRGETRELSSAGEGGRDRSLALVEAALFAADEPLTPKRLATVAGIADVSVVRALVAKLREAYEADGCAFTVQEVAGGYQLLTRPEFHPWLSRLRRSTTETHLSPAARETLTIIAYRQPVTRADIEAIRGVGCADVLRQLMEKGAVKLAGRDESLGRPALYETTKKFLQMYGLRSLKDLPPEEGKG